MTISYDYDYLHNTRCHAGSHVTPFLLWSWYVYLHVIRDCSEMSLRLTGKDETHRKVIQEMSEIEEDLATVQLLQEAAESLHTPHSELDTILHNIHDNLSKTLVDHQDGNPQLHCADLIISTE